MGSEYAIIGDMTYRVYLRWPEQRVSDKTTTESETVATLAWQELVGRQDLKGKAVGVAFSKDGKQIRFHRFDA